MRAYKQYSPTNQLWLPDVPSHWNIKKIKHLFSERSDKGHPEEPLLVSSQNMGVVPKNVYGNRTVEAQKDLHLLKLVRTGDFVISLRAFQGGIEYAYYQGIISPAYTIMINKGEIISPYFKYLAKSARFIDLLRLCVTGIREGQNIDYQRLKNYKIPVPPRDEQEQIVRFLDWKVSAINRLINLRRKEITALEDLKRSIIHHAVTHGIKPNVPMKDSGVQWIGNIPEHWEIIKLKAVSSMRAGNNLTATQINPNEGGYQVYGGNGQRGFYDDYNIDGEFLLIGRQGALCGNVHKVKGKIWATDHAVITRLMQEMNIDYGYYLLLAMNLNQYSSDTAAQPGLSVNVIKNLYTVLPPIKEQIDISSFLVDKCSQLNKTMNYTMQAISVLQELKARLISDVVTGKIDVRGVEVPEFAPVEEEAGTDIVEEEVSE